MFNISITKKKIESTLTKSNSLVVRSASSILKAALFHKIKRAGLFFYMGREKKDKLSKLKEKDILVPPPSGMFEGISGGMFLWLLLV